MLTAFGDGPNPIPQTVEATLLGARKLLQVTIQDARALRRQTKESFKKAQAQVAKGKLRKPTFLNKGTPEAIPDPEMLYRALLGYDRMARETKCGFNFENLKSLFPEEMRAYMRWNSLKEEYDKNTEGDGDGDAADAGEEKDDEPPPPAMDPMKEGGHLQERAEQFDLRTNLMDPSGYMKFSEHRRGSFLPKRIRQEGDVEWEENRKLSKAKGNKDSGVWSTMSAKSARFLHWVGFDPDNGLPPPNDETTQALAFLGYDFVGRIVEKAIFLKNLAKAKQQQEESDKDGNVDERNILLELQEGEQLDKGDIDNAMNDIRPAAMYSTNESVASAHKPVAQLYFGPGFEDRVEMELDELMLSNDGSKHTKVSDEEAKIRKAEDKLFAKMAALPTTNNAVMHLLGKEDDDNEDVEAELDKETSPNGAGKGRCNPRKDEDNDQTEERLKKDASTRDTRMSNRRELEKEDDESENAEAESNKVAAKKGTRASTRLALGKEYNSKEVVEAKGSKGDSTRVTRPSKRRTFRKRK